MANIRLVSWKGTGSMSPDEIKAVVRRIPEEIYNRGNLALADQVFGADYVEHVPLPPGFPVGLAGLKQFVTAVRTAFPDFRYVIEDEIAEGDRCVVRVTASGTMRGDFMGMPATGKHAAWQEIHIAQFAGGKLVEHWACIDQLGMLQQLGVIPAPGQPPR
jgi:predicted ester cyclase